MAKALFFSLPAHGHTNPSLPLVRELVARGDEVVYYSSDAFNGKVESTGARYRPYRSEFLADMRQLPERMDELSWILMHTTAEVLDGLDAFRAERPDYVITDSVAPWGKWVGDVLGVPVATSVSTFAFNRSVAAYGLAHGVRPKSAGMLASKIRHMFRALRLARSLGRRYNTKGPGIMPFVRSDLNVVYTSRVFQPREETFDDRYAFVGPTLTARDEQPFPWDRTRDAPVIYVSLGTIFNADSGFYQACFEAFGALDVQVIMAIGTNVAAESLGPVPANTIVQPRVPQLDVLRRTAAFVSHGGMNSVTESLYHGVPVVIIPQMSEQEIVGRRTEELGAGLYLSRADVTAGRLRECVRRLVAEEGFRKQAGVIRDSFLAAGGVVRAADALAAFVQSRDRRASAS